MLSPLALKYSSRGQAAEVRGISGTLTSWEMFAYSRSYPTSTYGQQDKLVSAKQPVRSSVVWLSEPNTPAEVLDSPPEKKPPLTALIIVRHAERIDSVLGKPPPAGKEGGYHNWITETEAGRARPWDPPLSEYGVRQSRLLGASIPKILEDYKLPALGMVYTSPTARCAETALAALDSYEEEVAQRWREDGYKMNKKLSFQKTRHRVRRTLSRHRKDLEDDASADDSKTADISDISSVGRVGSHSSFVSSVGRVESHSELSMIKTRLEQGLLECPHVKWYESWCMNVSEGSDGQQDIRMAGSTDSADSAKSSQQPLPTKQSAEEEQMQQQPEAVDGSSTDPSNSPNLDEPLGTVHEEESSNPAIQNNPEVREDPPPAGSESGWEEKAEAASSGDEANSTVPTSDRPLGKVQEEKSSTPAQQNNAEIREDLPPAGSEGSEEERSEAASSGDEGTSTVRTTGGPLDAAQDESSVPAQQNNTEVSEKLSTGEETVTKKHGDGDDREEEEEEEEEEDDKIHAMAKGPVTDLFPGPGQMATILSNVIHSYLDEGSSLSPKGDEEQKRLSKVAIDRIDMNYVDPLCPLEEFSWGNFENRKKGMLRNQGTAEAIAAEHVGETTVLVTHCGPCSHLFELLTGRDWRKEHGVSGYTAVDVYVREGNQGPWKPRVVNEMGHLSAKPKPSLQKRYQLRSRLWA